MAPPENWQRFQEIFEAAVELPEAEQRDYLDQACAGNAELRGRVEALLAATEGTKVIDDAIGNAAAAASESGSSELAPGSAIGRYQIVSRLGEGGMGHVYRALDTGLDREVAIKLINSAVLATETGRRRFEREAQAAAALQHRNIVTIHDIGEDPDQPFIVMELVEGETLRDKVAAGCAEEEFLPWVVQIAEAMAAAHEAGIVHRDLKPDNVIVDGTSTARIVDFGLAQLGRSATIPPEQTATLTRLTGVGTIMGTLGYMSPEAAAGQPTDHRTDQFALGAILYELATGQRLFEAKTPQELLAATLRDEPPLLEEVPPKLRVVLERCLAKDPKRRYEETAELLEALKALLDAPAPTRPLPEAIPKPRTALVGRDAEREAIRRLFIEDRIRLVTLTGPGGSGKTRLALQAAEDLIDHFGSRVFFVELSAIREAALVTPAIARALGAGGGQAPIDAIRAEFSDPDSRCLIVLDNFEQVVSAGRELGELLAKVESLSFLVTSREVLRIYGEYDLPVEPLAFPLGSSRLSVDELEKYPAVALFTDRARAARPSFELSAENAHSVAELCARLDGLPLALELAAARARTLSPQEMLARLESQKGLLAGGARDLPERQRTLRATLDWSYELVDESEQVLFRRLGVFVGGFTLEAAEAVADGYGDLEIDIVDGIASLVDKSLVQPVEGSDEASRFTLLETIREFTKEKLKEQGELDKMGKAHAAYYVLLAEEGGAALATGGSPKWLETFRVEHNNCRAALDWLSETGDAEWGLRLALGLFDFWDRTGQMIEGSLRYTKLLALETSHEHKRLRARGLFSAAAFSNFTSTPEGLYRLQKESLELYRELGDLRGQAVMLNAMGIVASTNSYNHVLAREVFTEALGVWAQLDDDTSYARTLSNLAWVLKTEGEHEEARRMYQQAGELFGAGESATEAAWAVNHEADVAIESGELDEAWALYTKALELFENEEYSWGIATTLADMAAIPAKKGDWAESLRLNRRALEMFAGLGHRRGIARLFESLSVGALEGGKPSTALNLVACATALREQFGLRLSGEEQAALEADIARMKTAAGPELADSAWAEGASATAEDAVRLALSF